MNSRKLAFTVALLGMVCVASGAEASPIISASISPTFALESFGTGTGGGTQQPEILPLVIGGETFTFTGQSGVYSGSAASVVASPFGNSNTNYLAAEPVGTLNIAFAGPQTAFDLLWGTVDDYNSLTFNLGGQIITGSQILAANPALMAGSTGAYVQISNLNPFTSISVTSTSAAFEFVPGVPVPPTVPEPLTLSLFGAGLAGAAALRRRKKAKQA
jgi:hypothetical protein